MTSYFSSSDVTSSISIFQPSPSQPSYTSPITTVTSSLTTPPLPITAVTPSPTSLVPPSLSHSPPYHNPPSVTMVDPIIYLISIPVIVGILLVAMVLMVCCIVICWQLRRKKHRHSGSTFIIVMISQVPYTYPTDLSFQAFDVVVQRALYVIDVILCQQ